jgi:hypothetical protein
MVPSGCDGYLFDDQAVTVGNIMYLLEGPGSSYGGPYTYLVRVPLGSPLRVRTGGTTAAILRGTRTAPSEASSAPDPAIALRSPGAMGAAPDGGLYVFDASLHEIVSWPFSIIDR